MNKKQLIILSDFDGTITLQDTGIVIIDEYLSTERRRELDIQIFNKTIDQREAFSIMWNSVTCDWKGIKDRLKDVKFDPYFKQFYDLIQTKSIPFTILSSGLIQILDWFVENNLTDFNSKIIANEGIYEKGYWEVKFHDDSIYGHDKAVTIAKEKQQFDEPLTVFIGDGVSDIMACKQADILFVKKGKDLETYCNQNNLDCIPFENFSTVINWLENYYN